MTAAPARITSVRRSPAVSVDLAVRNRRVTIAGATSRATATAAAMLEAGANDTDISDHPTATLTYQSARGLLTLAKPT